LGVDGPLPGHRVAGVNDHVRDVARVADAREQRDVPFAAALEDQDPLLIRLDAERLEHEWKRELLRAPLDEQRGPREEQLGAVAVELRQHAERLRFGERLRLEQRRADLRMVSYERELLDAIDTEEHGSVRRVTGLGPAVRE